MLLKDSFFFKLLKYEYVQKLIYLNGKNKISRNYRVKINVITVN